MPTISLGDLDLYYETFGENKPQHTPLVLIHGSTDTGANWGLAAPLLARNFFVIVPDCRGHGRSSNPRQSYSFSEMAADTAALVRALGFERAHILGHSNGGNVALLTLMEHPEVVQTAIIQAGNAYVSPDLGEKEPPVFDPERIGREDPEWHKHLLTAHTAVHGPDYWRSLLKLTLEAILSGPNYTPQDLAVVERPTLLIQGALDRVNAAGEHAQYMQANIPFAEMWLPEETGHNVHEERLLEWTARVVDFIERRGDDLNEALYRQKMSRYADEREYVFDVRARQEAEGGWTITGQVLHAGQVYVLEKMAAQALPGRAVKVAVDVLLNEHAPWALVRRGVADMRREPQALAERVSQLLLGEAVRILRTQGDWSLVRLSHDGYMGWTQNRNLHPCTEEDVPCYLEACNGRVLAELAPVFAAPNVTTGAGLNPDDYRIPGKLAFATRIQVTGVEDGWACIQLPDGLTAWMHSTDILMDEAEQPPVTAVLALMARAAGTPYLWGGRSAFGYDCSGFAQAFHAFQGVSIPRDADQQFRAGAPVAGDPRPGDLIFFGSPGKDDADRYAAITHVAISLGGAELIHANGTAWGVSFNSLSPDSPRYNAWLAEHVLGVRRLL